MCSHYFWAYRVTGSKIQRIQQVFLKTILSLRILEAFWSIGYSRSHKGSHSWQLEPFLFEKVGRVKQNSCSTTICAQSSCCLFFSAVHVTLGKKGCILKGSPACPSGEPLKVLCSILEESIEFLNNTANYPITSEDPFFLSVYIALYFTMFLCCVP